MSSELVETGEKISRIVGHNSIDDLRKIRTKIQNDLNETSAIQIEQKKKHLEKITILKTNLKNSMAIWGYDDFFGTFSAQMDLNYVQTALDQIWKLYLSKNFTKCATNLLKLSSLIQKSSNNSDIRNSIKTFLVVLVEEIWKRLYFNVYEYSLNLQLMFVLRICVRILETDLSDVIDLEKIISYSLKKQDWSQSSQQFIKAVQNSIQNLKLIRIFSKSCDQNFANNFTEMNTNFLQKILDFFIEDSFSKFQSQNLLEKISFLEKLKSLSRNNEKIIEFVKKFITDIQISLHDEILILKEKIFGLDSENIFEFNKVNQTCSIFCEIDDLNSSLSNLNDIRGALFSEMDTECSIIDDRYFSQYQIILLIRLFKLGDKFWIEREILEKIVSAFLIIEVKKCVENLSTAQISPSLDCLEPALNFLQNLIGDQMYKECVDKFALLNVIQFEATSQCNELPHRTKIQDLIESKKNCLD